MQISINASKKTLQTEKRMILLIEMEDILCNVTNKAAELLQVDEEKLQLTPAGEIANCSTKEVEDVLSDQPAEFWKSLEPTPEFSDIKSALLDSGAEIKIITKPYNIESSQEGKQAWVDTHFPEAQLIFTKSKHVFACKASTLIDCKPGTIQAFKRFGGKGIILPKPWQKNYKPQTNIKNYITESLSLHVGK